MLIAGIVWVLVASMLLFFAFRWLSTGSNINIHLSVISGVILALLIHHLGFLKIADSNMKRILLMDMKSCLFAFIPWRSYLIIAVMITMGAVLRHLIIPKEYLAVLYIGIGFALLLSSVRYLRAFINGIRKQ